MTLAERDRQEPQAASFDIIPQPVSAIPAPGVFLLTPGVTLFSDRAFSETASVFAERVRRATGFPLEAAHVLDESTPQIALLFDDACRALGPEGYWVTVMPRRVEIRAATAAGAFYGTQTLLQLMPAAVFGDEHTPGQEWAIPCAEIEDYPRFRWRGAMLDVSRHFMPLPFLRKFVDTLALHKLNTLHLHLNDDQGWRLEILKYPKLTEVGACRKETLIGRAEQSPADADFDPARQHFDGKPYEGFYTQAEMRDLVEYARLRQVTIVPEIEMPGHAQAAIAAYPELGCLVEPVEVSTTWGIHESLYNAEESTLAFLQDVLAEVIGIFPSEFIHVGGDEAVKAQWRNSLECQERIRELGVHDEAGLQSYFIRRMDEFLTERGRRLIGWDEILEGGLAPNAVVMSWRGNRGGIAAAGMGHDVVMAPYDSTYLDYYQSHEQDDEPLAFASVVTLADIYGFDPIPQDLSREFHAHILGAQAQLWTEYIPNEKQTEYQAFPRLSALAEVTWSPRDARDYAGFVGRLDIHLLRLDLLGVNYRPLKAADREPQIVEEPTVECCA